VDRALESRIEWEHFAVNREDHLTAVQPFPISVEFVEPPAQDSASESAYVDRASLFKELGVEASFLGVGVERVDYTKGIPERFLALERLFEKYPQYVGRFTFVQIGAPSRTHIKRYHDLLAEVGAEAERINWRFQTATWKPIVYLQRQHSHQEIQRYYRTADLCMVTSLHDGMNLVAKEFVAARHDEQGVLVLSRFAGAARELRDALIVNPYDIEQMAEGVRVALEMSPEDCAHETHASRRAGKQHLPLGWQPGGRALRHSSGKVRPSPRASPQQRGWSLNCKGYCGTCDASGQAKHEISRRRHGLRRYRSQQWDGAAGNVDRAGAGSSRQSQAASGHGP
jgi:trehalose 6-phosphate synthase